MVNEDRQIGEVVDVVEQLAKYIGKSTENKLFLPDIVSDLFHRDILLLELLFVDFADCLYSFVD